MCAIKIKCARDQKKRCTIKKNNRLSSWSGNKHKIWRASRNGEKCVLLRDALQIFDLWLGSRGILRKKMGIFCVEPSRPLSDSISLLKTLQKQRFLVHPAVGYALCGHQLGIPRRWPGRPLHPPLHSPTATAGSCDQWQWHQYPAGCKGQCTLWATLAQLGARICPPLTRQSHPRSCSLHKPQEKRSDFVGLFDRCRWLDGWWGAWATRLLGHHWSGSLGWALLVMALTWHLCIAQSPPPSPTPTHGKPPPHLCFPGGTLTQRCSQQKREGAQRDCPWGESESVKANITNRRIAVLP